MATTTVAHASLIRYDNDGNQLVINLKNTGDDVSINRSSNGNLPSGATTAQGLANALGSLAFKSSLSKTDVGLGSVDNTSDANKSVKYATTAGSANAVAWGNVSGKPSTFTPSTHAHSQYLEKTSYEYSKELACGGSDTLVLLGSFPCYDSNVTMTISCTAATSYYGVLIMATQNISTSLGGRLDLKLYGDDENILTPKISVSYVKGSNVISIYMKGDAWAKYLVHIQANALAGTPSGICTHVTEIPSTATRYPVNVSRSISDNDLVVSKTAPSRTCIWAKID